MLSTMESLSHEPLELMPCMGRHPLIRKDEESPTLAKVREVYLRRDEQDSKWVDSRREAIARRLALNAFKAREQQRELLLQVFKQKELHKVRMAEAEVRKTMIDAELEERTEVMSIQKLHRLMAANERAERTVDEKREEATLRLESWREGVVKCEKYIKKKEIEKRKEGEISLQKYMTRLNALGESRKVVSATQAQKNDELKTRIHASLSAQLEEQSNQLAASRSEAIETKQKAAAERRNQAQLGNRYHFIERAFGNEAIGFDAKHHAFAIDRRGNSWRKTADNWNKTKDSFSMPTLPPSRPYSTDGALSEAGLKVTQQTLSLNALA